MLLKQNLQDNSETGIILGFSDCYKEKMSEDDLKKAKEKNSVDYRFNVKPNLKFIF